MDIELKETLKLVQFGDYESTLPKFLHSFHLGISIYIYIHKEMYLASQFVIETLMLLTLASHVDTRESWEKSLKINIL